MIIDSTCTSILRQIDVDLMSICSKNIVYRNNILERLCVPCDKNQMLA